jgi:tetrapyrrole methylase family protein/MazG family protein
MKKEHEFDRLADVLDTLLGPKGCPWDQKQTMASIRTTVLEEVHELIDAIDQDDTDKIVEELGDLFFNALFFCKLGEKDKRFEVRDVLNTITEKLVRRHPHVFADAKPTDDDAIAEQWERIKKEEKGADLSALDDIPKTMPSLARAFKAIKRVSRSSYPLETAIVADFDDEAELGTQLLTIVHKAQQQGIDAEMALNKALGSLDRSYRSWEKTEAKSNI